MYEISRQEEEGEEEVLPYSSIKHVARLHRPMQAPAFIPWTPE